jgi:oxaloacetate decarboxylase beta subunit
MHAISANVAGQIGSVVAGGVVINIVSQILKNIG